jgi:hypothetical protein
MSQHDDYDDHDDQDQQEQEGQEQPGDQERPVPESGEHAPEPVPEEPAPPVVRLRGPAQDAALPPRLLASVLLFSRAGTPWRLGAPAPPLRAASVAV